MPNKPDLNARSAQALLSDAIVNLRAALVEAHRRGYQEGSEDALTSAANAFEHQGHTEAARTLREIRDTMSTVRGSLPPRL